MLRWQLITHSRSKAKKYVREIHSQQKFVPSEELRLLQIKGLQSVANKSSSLCYFAMVSDDKTSVHLKREFYLAPPEILLW